MPLPTPWINFTTLFQAAGLGWITTTPERSYGRALLVLAAIGVLGLIASLLLPATIAAAGVASPPLSRHHLAED